MATIEERAKQLASIQGGISDYGKKVIEKCCIKIATDQQKIDIEKACAWLYKSIPRIKEVYLDKDISERDKEDIINDFIKAIEK